MIVAALRKGDEPLWHRVEVNGDIVATIWGMPEVNEPNENNIILVTINGEFAINGFMHVDRVRWLEEL